MNKIQYQHKRMYELINANKMAFCKNHCHVPAI